MKKVMVLLPMFLFMFSAQAEENACPDLTGDYLCVSSAKKVALASVSIVAERGVNLMIVDFGSNSGGASAYPLGGEISFEGGVTLRGSCQSKEMIRVEAHFPDAPNVVRVRELVVENGVNFKVMDSVRGSPVAAISSMRCDRVLY